MILLLSKICVSLIIGDHSENLSHCLDSVKEIADCISVCDVGCTREADDALFIFDDFLETAHIPTYISTFEDTPFDSAYAIEAAKEAIENAHLPMEDTYILFLEPHGILKVGASFDKTSLEDDSYLLLDKSTSLSCYQYTPRMIRAAAADGFRGCLNKSSSYQAPLFSSKLRTLMIELGPRESHLESLLKFHKKDPQNGKILFAIAQEHFGLRHLKEASRWYAAHIKTGGEGEEIWFSKYKIGECFEEQGQWDDALSSYLEAFETDPKRPEPLLKIASHYRHAGYNNLAFLFAKHGSLIPFPQKTNLFPFLCNYQFDEEISIAAFYTRFREEGFASGCNLILKRHVPWEIKDQTYRNLLFYVSKLKNTEYLDIDFDLPIIEDTNQRYHPMNPSIHRTQNGYQVICRVVNYKQEGARHFETADLGGIYRSKNFLLNYDKDFHLLSQSEIIEKLEREKIPRFLIEGIEDCRIFEYSKKIWFTCTSFDTNPTGNLQISLCKLKDTPVGSEIAVEKLTPLIGPDPYRCEKNWLPFIKNGAIHVIYSYDPFIVYRLDENTGACEEIVNYKPRHDFSRFRGSAAPIPFGSGYLMMVHEIAFLAGNERKYLHRFLYLDSDFRVQMASKPFIFDHFGVEFCCGMTQDHSGKKLVMAIGLEDAQARLGIIDFDDIWPFLEPLPPLTDYLFENE